MSQARVKNLNGKEAMEWRRRARAAMRAGARTPFFLIAAAPLAKACEEWMSLDFGKPSRHWYSFKTQPAAPVVRWWRDQGWPVEVVSEFEFRAARAEGFGVDALLVNGPAKHRWLGGVAIEALRVNFDSLAELAVLLPTARRLKWRVGLRVQMSMQQGGGDPKMADPFGMSLDEAAMALKQVRRAGLEPETLHFHLRTQLPEVGLVARALTEVADLCGQLRWRPRYLDSGGGAPAPNTWAWDGLGSADGFQVNDWVELYRRRARDFPWVQEYWFETGRRLLAPSGVLVLRVWDEKKRDGVRRLICDGGRTLHALVSTWEQHRLAPLEDRRGRKVLTAVHGPTCMGFDRCYEGPMERSIGAGDHLIWMDAGAYHLPWETRFSHGLAEVWWDDGRRVALARPGESFEEYWAGWRGK